MDEPRRSKNSGRLGVWLSPDLHSAFTTYCEGLLIDVSTAAALLAIRAVKIDSLPPMSTLAPPKTARVRVTLALKAPRSWAAFRLLAKRYDMGAEAAVRELIRIEVDIERLARMLGESD